MYLLRKRNRLRRFHSATIYHIYFFIDLWQQEKERRLREKGIKQRIRKCCPDCWADHHSEWYSLNNTLLSLFLFFSLFATTNLLFLALSKLYCYCLRSVLFLPETEFSTIICFVSSTMYNLLLFSYF